VFQASLPPSPIAHPPAGVGAGLAGTPDPDADLLIAARAGDTRAFEALVARLARPALALAARVLGDAALAEDAVQDALTRLWREAHRFDPARGRFGGWWRRILLNSALDGRRRLRPAAPLDAIAEPADPAPGPLAAAEAADLDRQLSAAMAQLPARQRAALALFHGDGLSMAEIAAVLETSPKAVEGLLLRGRAVLRHLLRDALGEDGE
jgi:RNA polymerase sigma-70 factor (ECF subfamily)